MNTEAMSEPVVEVQRTSHLISPGQQFYWSVRREIWENRSIYLAPLAVAGLIVLATLIAGIHLPRRLEGEWALDPMDLHKSLEGPYTIAAGLIMFTTLLVALFYCLESFQGERRDRSVLFWKSLPVSDTTTVLAKAVIPILVLPLVTYAITVATQIVMLLLNTIRLAGSGKAGMLWSHLSFSDMWGMLFFHLIALHGLWWAPFYSWILMVSAWARRAPLLWAGLPLLALGLLEKIAFNSTHFVGLLERFLDGPGEAPANAEKMSMASMTPGTPLEFFSSPGLWIGLAVTALFLFAAVQFRRSRGPS